ncbi:hypothetical protein EDD15DRAFT_437315 [Pisolithus albus]|nr:hypothetical protein EDD15DRAFT_437315 [Pisolithus albus]
MISHFTPSPSNHWFLVLLLFYSGLLPPRKCSPIPRRLSSLRIRPFQYRRRLAWVPLIGYATSCRRNSYLVSLCPRGNRSVLYALPPFPPNSCDPGGPSTLPTPFYNASVLQSCSYCPASITYQDLNLSIF